ncbi:MAG: hypothetical protein WCD86_00845, partial [Ktedonobacteraceae bacterium]
EAYLSANIHTYYDPQPATFFDEVMQAKKQIQQEQDEKRQNGEPSQWNGEKYHLSKIVINREPIRESITLGLWFKPRDHYTGLATRRCLDNPDFRVRNPSISLFLISSSSVSAWTRIMLFMACVVWSR